MEVFKSPFSTFKKEKKNGPWYFCLFLIDYLGSLELIFVKAKNFCSKSEVQTENFSAAKHLLILEKAADGLSLADQVSFVLYYI